MMYKKRFLKMLCVVLIIILFAVDVCPICTSANTVKLKKISLNEGETYKIKCGKKSSFVSTNSKIATVSKKGKIKAKKKGKCIIKAKNGKKVLKYRVTVKSVDKVEKKNNSDNNEIMQRSNNIESNSSGESKQKTVSDGGVMMINGLKIISIEPIDNNFSKVRMQIISSESVLRPSSPEIRFVEIEASISHLSELSVGDNVKIGYSSGYNYFQEKGDTYYIANHPYIGKS